jgi:hypothetical protein
MSKKDVPAIVSAMGVFTSIISSLTEHVKKFGGTMENIYRLATPEGSETLEKIARLIVGAVGEAKDCFLKLVSGGESLVIKAKTGKRKISQMKDLFTWGIDSDFVNYGADQEGAAMEDTQVKVYELAKNGTFSDIFGSLPFSNEQLCLTQDQIIGFVEEHRRWLSTNGGTFFLFKSA